MKKVAKVAMAGLVAATSICALGGCAPDNTIYVNTNAFFAPFEYYDDDLNIVGVDVDIMNLVGEELGRPVKFENTAFDLIIDNVASGAKFKCGAAGITITTERQESVDFSNPYYTAVQYVIYDKDNANITTSMTANNDPCVFWEDLMDKRIGVQRNTTGDLFVSDEIDGGVLDGKAEDDLVRYDSASVALTFIGSRIDVVVVDELPAQFLCSRNTDYTCLPLYYDADTATEEQYAICVTKGQDDLLAAINKVLDDLGESGIQALVARHLGLDN